MNAKVEREAAFARAVGIYEAANIRLNAVERVMPAARRIREDGGILPTAEQQRDLIEQLKLAIVALEEAAVAAEVYQEADAALRLGAGKAG